MAKEIKVNVGGGFFGILALIFITLKLLDKIQWSWVWVLAPLWIPLGLWVAGFIVALIYFVAKDIKERRR